MFHNFLIEITNPRNVHCETYIICLIIIKKEHTWYWCNILMGQSYLFLYCFKFNAILLFIWPSENFHNFNFLSWFISDCVNIALPSRPNLNNSFIVSVFLSIHQLIKFLINRILWILFEGTIIKNTLLSYFPIVHIK